MKSKRKKIDPSILSIINHLQVRNHNGNLCAVGQERLKWWRANVLNFKNAKEAVLSWPSANISAWFSDRGRHSLLPYGVRMAPITYSPHVTISFSAETVETMEIKAVAELLVKLVKAQPIPQGAMPTPGELILLRAMEPKWFGAKYGCFL